MYLMIGDYKYLIWGLFDDSASEMKELTTGCLALAERHIRHDGDSPYPSITVTHAHFLIIAHGYAPSSSRSILAASFGRAFAG